MMSFTETPIPGAWVVDLHPREDERGFFVRAWDGAEYRDRGIDPTVAQINMSHSSRAGTFRGFHLQEPPHAETKTMRCVSGATYNVIVDMRPESVAYKTWFGVHLTPENMKMLCVPEGVANGFLVMEDDARVFYQVSRPYHPDAVERGVRFDDPSIGIEWPIPVTLVSEKDGAWPLIETDN